MKIKIFSRASNLFSFFILIALIALWSPLSAQSTLWQIGKTDQNYEEFSLVSEGYASFHEDGFFVVGDSDPLVDWPFVHAGPSDGWAGNRKHSFTILFGLKSLKSSDKNCHLVFDLVDTHSLENTQVQVMINHNSFKQELPMGGGDESVQGHPEKGKPFRFTVEFPVNMLQQGNNNIEIINSSGSWFLYDAITLETPFDLSSTSVTEFVELEQCVIKPAIYSLNGANSQDLTISLKYAGEPKTLEWWYNKSKISVIDLKPGSNSYTCRVPEILKEQHFTCSLKDNNQTMASSQGFVKPTGHKTIYILPHSHTDIGYTDIQTAIEDKQVENLRQGIRFAKETADYPEGSRFIWNVEVSWAADLYLNRLGEKDKKLFTEAINKGWISINGMYLNELTGLCRPEELLRLFRYSTQLTEQTGVKVDAAMISDVPGYTWGTVTAMAQAGIKYFSVAPNYFDRIGDILVQWENKPFYWLSPSGKEKVLVWIPFKGYAWSHTIRELNNEHANDFLDQLDQMNYPYDIAYMRWSGHGDNAVPEPQICDFVRDWNAKYAWPRFIISSTSEAFTAFEEQNGNKLEEMHGDWTPYWEDGAGSSALETAMNRNTADRLTQAASLFTLGESRSYPAEKFDEAWKQTLLYSEHTWGAWCSITDPENQMTVEQWDIKGGYAREAERMSQELLKAAMNDKSTRSSVLKTIINSCAWTRMEPLTIQAEQAEGFQSVLDDQNHPVPSQLLNSGELVFIPHPTPAYSQSQYKLSSSVQPDQQKLSDIVNKNILDNGILRVEIDPASGNIRSLEKKGINGNLVETDAGQQMNQYVYFEGKDITKLKTNGQCQLKIIENGAVYGVIEVRSPAPGCHELVRRYTLASGMDYLEIENIVDKERISMPEKIGDWYLAQNKNKESVNFAFPFHVPNGVMRLDLPIGSMVPWIDQIPSACKNWFSVGRYGDISNQDYGVTWFTLDAPLVEVGEISANLVGSQTNPAVWRKEVKPTQTLYSWAMNNHWGTNYRQYQEGPVSFRYAIRPHKNENAAETYRLATSMSQPLFIRSGKAETHIAPFTLQGSDIVPVSIKPADNGSGFILRLYNPDQLSHSALLNPQSGKIYLSNTGEQKLKKMDSKIELAGMEMITILIE